MSSNIRKMRYFFSLDLDNICLFIPKKCIYISFTFFHYYNLKFNEIVAKVKEKVKLSVLCLIAKQVRNSIRSDLLGAPVCLISKRLGLNMSPASAVIMVCCFADLCER